MATAVRKYSVKKYLHVEIRFVSKGDAQAIYMLCQCTVIDRMWSDA